MGQVIQEAKGSAVYVPGDDIDTDRITPARFLRCVTFDGLGKTVFYDERFDSEGHAKSHPLNDAKFTGASVMVSGRNFGCGSSREHAPQALVRAGFKAVIAESFAEIFFGNSVTLGMLCVSVSRDDRQEIAKAVEANPGAEVVIQLEEGTVQVGDTTYPMSLPQTAKDAFLAGEWDPLAMLLDGENQTKQVFQQLPYTGWARS
jgi:3-isopropylmalate/(R)-2-methylmalate dehydratase small subunit